MQIFHCVGERNPGSRGEVSKNQLVKTVILRTMAEAVQPEENKEEVQPADFTGAWVLKTNENLDAFLKSQGVGWAVRKVAAAASMTINIEQSETSLKIKAKLPIGSPIDQDIPLDGTKITNKTPTGDDGTIIIQWKDDKKQVLVMKTENLTKKTSATIERYMPDKDTMKDDIVNAKGVKMTRIFNRKK